VNLTQEEVRDISGVSQASISRLERQESEDIQLSTVMEIAIALNWTVEELIGMTPEVYAKRAKRLARRGRHKLSTRRATDTAPDDAIEVQPGTRVAKSKRTHARTKAAKA
jgi:transcriptional regulator with XRE-family HTH domain